MGRHPLFLAAILAALGCGQPPAPDPLSPPAVSTAPAPRDSAAAVPVAATLDTVRVAGQRPPEPGGPRDPRTEPLFVNYASPGEMLRLRDAFPWIDMDKVRWRYSPPDSADSSKGR